MTNGSPSDAGDDDHLAPTDASSYPWSERDEPALSIIEAVAEVTGVDPTALPTLYDAVDVDAMNRVLSGRADDAAVSISFEYADRVVGIDSDGEITVGY